MKRTVLLLAVVVAAASGYITACCPTLAVRPGEIPRECTRQIHTQQVEERVLPACIKLQRVGDRYWAPSNVRLMFQALSCDGQPVVNLRAEEFQLYEDLASISQYESQQAILPLKVASVQYTLLLLDMSGSVVDSGNLPNLMMQASQFVSNLAANQRVALAAFDGRVELTMLIDFTDDADRLRSTIEGLSSWTVVDPSTNLYGAVVAGLTHIEARSATESQAVVAGNLVVMTDGTDQAARVSEAEALTAVTASRFAVYAVGIGGEVNQQSLKRIGKTRSVFARWDDLGDRMKEIAETMDLFARAYYVLGYCSPKRNGVHDVTVELKVSGKSRVTSLFDATGFGPGCDADKIENPCATLECGQYGSTDCGNCATGYFCEEYVCLPDSVREERERQKQLAQQRLDEAYSACGLGRSRLLRQWRQYELDKAADREKDCGRRVDVRFGASLLALDWPATAVSIGQRVLPFLEVHGGVGLPGWVLLADLRFLPLSIGSVEFMLTPRFGYSLANDSFSGEVDALAGMRIRLARMFRLLAEAGVGYSWTGDEAYVDNQGFFFPIWCGAEMTW